MKYNRRRQTADNHIHTVTTTLADGSVRTYRYHRKTKTRLLAEPGSIEFHQEIEQAESKAAGTTALVYFVRAEALNLVKIGSTRDIVRRMTALRAASPDKLQLLGVVRDPANTLEAKLLAQYANARVHGEWFRPTAALLALIEGLEP